MKKNLLTLCALCGISFLISSCSSDKLFEQRVESTLKNNPKLVLKVIEENPDMFLTSLQVAINAKQEKLAKEQQASEQKRILAAIEKPLEPEINSSQLIRGEKNAPITIVEYSDFECPYCARSKQTIAELNNKYPGKIRFVFKHLPLSFHPHALISAKYYEAISLQSPQKAFEFHDQIFSNQHSLKQGEAFLTRIAKDLKVDMTRLKKDLHSPKVIAKIDHDISEARKFNFEGTPGFLINGVPVRGAVPAQHFENIIAQLKAKGSLSL